MTMLLLWLFRLLVLLVKENYSRLDKDTKSAQANKERVFPIPGKQTTIQSQNSNENTPLLSRKDF